MPGADAGAKHTIAFLRHLPDLVRDPDPPQEIDPEFSVMGFSLSRM